jgi:hypothetical protein
VRRPEEQDPAPCVAGKPDRMVAKAARATRPARDLGVPLVPAARYLLVGFDGAGGVVVLRASRSDALHALVRVGLVVEGGDLAMSR